MKFYIYRLKFPLLKFHGSKKVIYFIQIKKNFDFIGEIFKVETTINLLNHIYKLIEHNMTNSKSISVL